MAAIFLACAVSAALAEPLKPVGWSYNPYDYFPYTSLQPPAQETAEVAAARAAHMAAKVAATRSIPQILVQDPYVPQDTPEVWAAKNEHYRAVNAAAAANGVAINLPPLSSVPQDTPEVWAAKAEFFRAYNAAAARL